jgi:prepilin peptidase CpaA
LILTAVLIAALFADLRFRKIPNRLTFPAALAGLACHTWLSGASGLLFSITGILAGIALLIGFYILGGMGAGDVKLMGSAGALLGPGGVFNAFIFTAVLGGIYALVLVLRHGHLRSLCLHFRLVLTELIITGRIGRAALEYGEGLPSLRYGAAIAAGTLSSVMAGLI